MSPGTVAERTGGAPISWGVSEAPGWGYELAPERVLAEMRETGLRATELGPAGYLGPTPEAVRTRLLEAGMTLIGGFVPVTMHVDAAFDLDAARSAMQTLVAGGAEVVVLAAQSEDGSYDRKVVLDDDQWTVLLANLSLLQSEAAALGLTCTLHPHVGTAIESRDSVVRLLESSDVLICLDTGHLLIGGMQPAELLERAADRVAHVHLKDVDLAVAATVAAGDTSYLAAVRKGLYTPLGYGDLDITGILAALDVVGYQGWYVLEQDCALYDEPPPGTGPVEDVRRSIAFLAGTGA